MGRKIPTLEPALCVEGAVPSRSQTPVRRRRLYTNQGVTLLPFPFKHAEEAAEAPESPAEALAEAPEAPEAPEAEEAAEELEDAGRIRTGAGPKRYFPQHDEDGSDGYFV
jgi:hypothetical protein